MSLFFPFFGFGRIFYVGVLLANAICILSEDRFLARIGWARSSSRDPGFGAVQDTQSVGAKLINGMNSIRTVASVPLIAINLFIILYELIAG